MFATWITSQIVFDGVVTGMVFGLLAMGIVLVYRSTRVINFAVGNMGLVGATLLAVMVINHSLPFWLSALAALLIGTLFGVVVELVVIRRLFVAPRVIVLVATIGISTLSLAIVSAFPVIDPDVTTYPVASGKFNDILGLRVSGPQLSIFVVVPIVALALSWFLNRTLFGKTVKAAAENPDLARVRGINPKLVSTVVWAIAGFLATLTMILIAGKSSTAPADLVRLGPSTMVRALAAAALAGMTSFPRAMLAGVVVGVVQALITFNVFDRPGLTEALLFLAVLAAVAVQSRGSSRSDTQTFSFAPKVRAIPAQLQGVWWVRRLNMFVLGVLFVVAVVVPLLVTEPSKHLLYTTILCFAIAALSLTVLTGWGGQISLGQMAFAGIGALTAAAFTRGLKADLGLVDLHLQPLPFLFSIALAALVTAALAALVGAGALRVRGLLLAVSTFAFAVAAQQYFYVQPILSGGASSQVFFPRGTLFGLDLSSQRSYYYVVLVVLMACVAVVSHLRASGAGRTTIAVRDNADSAAAFTVSPGLTKLKAFALAGALAGLGGALLAGALAAVPFREQYFLVDDSLLLVAIAVIGGIASPMGAVIGALWVIGLPTFFPDNDIVPLLTSSLGLLVLLLYFPGGFVQIAFSARDALFAWAAKRRPEISTARVVTAPATLRRVVREAVAGAGAMLEVHDVHVHFGGIIAVDGASLSVGADEIVGLIGTNGAGKSTLMNAIGGFVRATGSVRLLGEEISQESPPRRARAGLGRTFQAARLFPELTVRETVQVALESHGRTGFVSIALCLPHAMTRERAKRAHADELIAFLGLGRYADTRISDLSTGTRRIVELACLLALDPKILCLDEPTAGVAQRETEAFGPLIQEVRREMGAAMLIIEHDMPLIMGISDRVYCLEVGRVIAEGVPDLVRSDLRVIASYLGTDERSIARSGEVPGSVSPGSP